jgi:hypothetical protein
MAEPSIHDLFVELITHIIALIKDDEKAHLTPLQRTTKRTRAYELSEILGARLER